MKNLTKTEIMKFEELLPIQIKDENSIISAKTLHSVLNVKTGHILWCKRMFDYGFEENVDYSTFKSETSNNEGISDYALTLDTAKQIAMIQKSDVGTKVRQYFIHKEKEAQDLTETIQYGIENDLKAVDSIEAKYTAKINKGERKVVKSFLREIIRVKGVSEVGNSVIIVKNDLNKDKKEWFLKQVSTTFRILIEESKGSWVLQNATALESTKAIIASQYGEFSRRSNGQNKKASDKEYKRLRRAKDGITKAFLDMKPKSFTGSFETIDDEYITDDENIHFVISISEFTNEKDELITFRTGTVLIKSDSLYLQINGGEDADMFRTKSRDFEKAMYETNIQLNFDDNTYQLRAYKLK